MWSYHKAIQGHNRELAWLGQPQQCMELLPLELLFVHLTQQIACSAASWWDVAPTYYEEVYHKLA